MSDRATFYEFFAGGGMARAGLGVEWECLLANDISPMKGAAYSANFGDDDLRVCNIYDLKVSQLPGHADLAWGSFPCQDLSLAGNGAGLDGERSGVFWGYWQLIRSLNRQKRKPRAIVVENVCGALTSHGGADFETIISAVVAEGYVVGALVMDAVHFLPQSRPRLFIVGVDASMQIPHSLVAEGPNPAWHPDAMVRAHNRLPVKVLKSWRWWNVEAPDERLQTLDDLIEEEPLGVKWHTPAQTKSLLEMMSPVNRQKVLAAQASRTQKVGTIYRRTRLGEQRAEVRFDGVSGCLRTPSGGSSRQTIIVVNGPSIRTRLLSPREAARLMGLPDEYALPERYNDAYHLAGDGVAVPVVAHLAKNLLNPIVEKNRAASSGQRAA